MKEPTQKQKQRMKEILKLPPEERVSDFGDELTTKIMGILVGFKYQLEIRDMHMDIITSRQAEKEIKELITDQSKK